jgi:hypothetical protein
VTVRPRAADLDPADIETALLRGAVGDYADEAAILLLINFGHWLPQLQSADLITLGPDLDGDGPWAQIGWPHLESVLSAELIVGSGGEVQVLRAAASIADGSPVDLGDLAAGLDRDGLALVLAAVAHAGGSHGDDLPPLAAWPARD